MSEMIERVAEAIYDADGGKGWHLHAEFYRKAARAAIEAMRRPTEEMYRAAWEAEVSCSYTESAHAWGAMIDVALSKAKPSQGDEE